MIILFKHKRGFTIVEVLIATLILAIFVSMAIVGTSALFGTGEQMMTVAEAAVLGSDVMKIVMNELRFGEEFKAEETETPAISYNSTAYGDGCVMKMGTDDHAGRLIIEQSSRVAAEGITPKPKQFMPIGTAAYDEVRIKSITFKVEVKKDAKNNPTHQVISCTLSITSNGENTLWEKTVTIVPLAQKAAL